MDMKEKKLTVIGTVDPVNVVSKLRKFWHTEIIAVGPAKEPEKKEDGKKEEAKKEEEKKEEGKKEDGKKEEGKKEDEKKKEPAPDPVLEWVKAYRAYNPYMTTHYHVQSMEENPNACVIF
ncbi:heavy metal-associated isoprenylated plant protein 39-like isoform X2 [Cicer arietinum]|nr:heavy metal-associated isoprenylated plant protein 39-like isoform X3 [Cicer arietinum]